MAKYFNNNSFLESIPGNLNQTDNSKGNIVLYLILGAGIGTIIGIVAQYAINKNHILKLKLENNKLKKTMD